MSSKWLCAIALAGCGGAHGHARAPDDIRLVPTVALQRWYRSPAPCGQGPYELDIPTRGAQYGEDVELRVVAPHAVAVQAVALAGGTEVARDGGVYEGDGATSRGADNARCLASVEERLALSRASGGATTGAPAPGTAAPALETAAAPPVQLAIDDGEVATSAVVLHVRVPSPGAPIRVRFWSVDPNDLTGVRFGIADITWAPNVPEARYRAYLAAQAEAARREAQAEVAAAARVEVRAQVVDPAAQARAEAEAEARAQREEREREEAARRAAIAAALEAERRRARAAYCDAHPDDRDCWGAGGRRVHDALDAHARERAAYCAAHAEDVRCWTDADWAHRRTAWDARVAAALAPPRQPDGPPPAPLVEVIPPRLSTNATWRPGYWQWVASPTTVGRAAPPQAVRRSIENKWVWLAGMWRVPDSDIASEQTTRAPEAPPPPRAEPVPPAPVAVALWVAGFWQWNGSSWVWVPGSWQLRPAPGATWQPAVWQPHGTVHVLIPGRWVRP